MVKMTGLKLPLTNIQIELIKLYSTDLSETDLDELKGMLSKFYGEKAILKTNQIWDDKGLTDADMEGWLNKKS